MESGREDSSKYSHHQSGAAMHRLGILFKYSRRKLEKSSKYLGITGYITCPLICEGHDGISKYNLQEDQRELVESIGYIPSKEILNMQTYSAWLHAGQENNRESRQLTSSLFYASQALDKTYALPKGQRIPIQQESSDK